MIVNIDAFISNHGFTVFCAVALLMHTLWVQRDMRKDNTALRNRVYELEGQMIPAIRDMATVMEETNRLVKRIFRILDDAPTEAPSSGDSQTGDELSSTTEMRVSSALEETLEETRARRKKASERLRQQAKDIL